MSRPDDGTEDFDERCRCTDSCDCPECVADSALDDCDGTTDCLCFRCTASCHWCGGDGWDECGDPIQCTSPHNEWDECECSSCGGSGLRRDMTIW